MHEPVLSRQEWFLPLFSHPWGQNFLASHSYVNLDIKQGNRLYKAAKPEKSPKGPLQGDTESNISNQIDAGCPNR